MHGEKFTDPAFMGPPVYPGTLSVYAKVGRTANAYM